MKMKVFNQKFIKSRAPNLTTQNITNKMRLILTISRYVTAELSIVKEECGNSFMQIPPSTRNKCWM